MTLRKEIETKIKMVVTVVFFDFHLLSHKHVYRKTIQQKHRVKTALPDGVIGRTPRDGVCEPAHSSVPTSPP